MRKQQGLLAIVRLMLVVATVSTVIGMTAIVVGDSLNRDVAPLRSNPQINPVQKSTSSVELMHDVAPVSDALPNIAIPQTVVAIPRVRVITMEVTAYCACTKCCGPNAQGITASGKLINYNDGKFVAADTSVLPFGTKLMIPGYDNRPVEVIDRGGAIKGNKIDVFYTSHQEALKWGRQHISVTVVE